MIFADKLIMGSPILPIGMQPPATYTTQTMYDLSSTTNYVNGVFTESGWYRVKIGAADGYCNDDIYSSRCGKGGYASAIFFAYKGEKFLLWGCDGVSTGFPWPYGNGPTSSYAGPSVDPEDGDLGGGGGNGSAHTFYNTGSGNVMGRGGPGGGGSTGNGGSYSGSGGVLWQGGAGAGFIGGINTVGIVPATETESYTHETFSINNVLTMVLAGGGGSWGSSAGGGGGGAWGNGGDGYVWGTSSDFCIGGTGSSAVFGRGADGAQGTYNNGLQNGYGGDGAWCVRDFTTETYTYGTGTNSRPAAQVCILEKLIY